MKILFKPLNVVLGILSGLIAKRLFSFMWAKIGDGEPADPDDRDAGWKLIMLSAALHGAVYMFVQAVVRRAALIGVERATGVWPGGEDEDD